MITVTFLSNEGKTVQAPENSNLLRISLREKGGIPFRCGSGICGTCKRRIEQGIEHTDAIKPKERKHLTEAQFAEGWRMACQTFLNGDQRVLAAPGPESAYRGHAEEERDMKQVSKLELAEARTMASGAIKKAIAIGVPETVCICNEGDYPLVLERMDGARVTGPQIAWNKAFTAACHKRSTHLFSTPPNGPALPGNEAFDIQWSFEGRFAVFVDGFLIVVDGAVVGGIGLSGDNGEQHRLRLGGAGDAPRSARPGREIGSDGSKYQAVGRAGRIFPTGALALPAPPAKSPPTDGARA